MKLGQIPDGLFDENTLIEAARTALEAQDSPSAIAFLERHARLHPTGQMEEEREALWVRALAAEGDGVDARARAAHFRRRFPRSIQLQVVSAALDTIP
jgi:outer membrane protein assembly factor BamD (BamD/ComL family)